MTTPATPPTTTLSDLMPAITVRLPWAAALRTGAKPVENRGKPIQKWWIGRQISIHASATFDRAAAWDLRILDWWHRTPDRREPVDATNFSYMFRKVISVGTLTDCHQAVTTNGVACCAPWGEALYGPKRKVAWHYVFADMALLPEPVGPVRGNLLLPWILPAAEAALVRQQLAEVGGALTNA